MKLLVRSTPSHSPPIVSTVLPLISIFKLALAIALFGVVSSSADAAPWNEGFGGNYGGLVGGYSDSIPYYLPTDDPHPWRYEGFTGYYGGFQGYGNGGYGS